MLLTNSPEERIYWPAARQAGVEVWIKRDDLIHPVISGNKWRKLRPIVELAQQRQTKTLVSYGGAYSNHLLALAAAAPLYGMLSRGIVRGEIVDNPVLRLCRLYGMELEFMDRETFRLKRDETKKLCFEGEECVVPEGANCAEGRSGMKSLWEELTQDYSHLVDSVGSGTSVRGLNVARPENTELLAVMAVNDRSLARNLESEGVRVFLEYVGGGFAKMNAELEEICRAFATQTGILLDPVYTAKQWKALLDLLEKGYFKRGDKVLFIHSGGLTGWLGTTSPRFL